MIAISGVVAAITIPRFTASAASARGANAAAAIAAHFTSAVESARVSGTAHAVLITESPPAITTFRDPTGTPELVARLNLARPPFGYEKLTLATERFGSAVGIGPHGGFDNRGVVVLENGTSRSAVVFGYAPGDWLAGGTTPAGAVDVVSRSKQNPTDFGAAVDSIAKSDPITSDGTLNATVMKTLRDSVSPPTLAGGSR